MKITVTAFLLAERNMEVDHVLLWGDGCGMWGVRC